MNIPERFEIDGIAEVCQDISDKPIEAVLAITERMQAEKSQLANIVNAVAGFAEPITDKSPLDRSMRNDAFRAGGYIALDGFFRSALPSVHANRTLKHFSFGFIPPDILNAHPSQIQPIFQTYAEAGFATHPEIERASELLEEYYTGLITNYAEIHQASIRGLGFTTYMLDESWRYTFRKHQEKEERQLEDARRLVDDAFESDN